MGRIRIAMIQCNPCMGDLEGNLAKLQDGLDRAEAAGADLALFPELALCGYPPEDLLFKPQFIQDCQGALARLAGRVRDMAAVVGFPETDGEHLFNAAAVLQQGRLLGTHRKLELPNYGVFDEKRYFAPGETVLGLTWGGLRLAVSVCEDIWVTGGSVEQAVRAGGMDIVLNLSASPFYAGKLAVRQKILKDFSRRTGAAVCYCNLVGGQDELVFDGGGLLVLPEGIVAAGSSRFEENLLVVDIPEVRRRDRPAPHAASRFLALAATGGESPGAEAAPPPVPVLSLEEEVRAALVLGTRDYVRKNGFAQVVVGLSGGIDSALTAAVAAEALGAENVVTVTMPSTFTSPETLRDAQRLAGNLATRLLTLPIEPIFKTFREILGPVLGPGEEGVTHENLQARIRGTLLMALSNRFGWLVLTTGNKSETATGYCTLYGDMAGGFAVIKDVPKTLVYRLAALVNRRGVVIPESILERAPSAELRLNQKDEDSLPPYAVLDPILHAYVEEDRSVREISALGWEQDVVREVLRRVDRSEYKRRQAPPGVKITPKAFGRDRRLPITNAYHADRE